MTNAQKRRVPPAFELSDIHPIVNLQSLLLGFDIGLGVGHGAHQMH